VSDGTISILEIVFSVLTKVFKMKYVSPSIKETAFNCPHCGTLTTQYWYKAHVETINKGQLPHFVDAKVLEEIDLSYIEDREQRAELEAWFQQMEKGRPFLAKGNNYNIPILHNVWLSRCYNCDEITIWRGDQMIYPSKGDAPAASPDMPADIRRDYEEASTILNQSPRGAAALIRFAIDKLCRELADPKQTINANIKTLVASGLDARVQKALDAVRVIGNNAVHPGQIDLRDDRATAESLFRLLNIIVEKMISEGKHIDEVFAGLPEGAKEQISKRDGKGAS
jgi:predicted RNA-binding Zn-ribbon protein involved in translation (DUF1610 family)